MKSVFLIILIACATYVWGMPSKLALNPEGMDNVYLFSDLPSPNSVDSRYKSNNMGCCDQNYLSLLKVPKFLYGSLDAKDIEAFDKSGIAFISVNTNPNDNAYYQSKRNLDSIGAGMKYKDADNMCNKEMSPYDYVMLQCFEYVVINGKLLKCYNSVYVMLVNGNVTLKKGKSCDLEHVAPKTKKNFDEIDKASNSFSTLNQLI